MRKFLLLLQKQYHELEHLEKGTAMYIDEKKFNRICRLIEQHDDQHIRSVKELRRQIMYCVGENQRDTRRNGNPVPWESYRSESGMEYECEDCDECDLTYDLCQLIDSLVSDIIHLEEETVKWREALLPYLSTEDADGLRSDIFSDLAGRHTDETVYEVYMRTCGIKTDRLEASEHLSRMRMLKNGIAEDTVRF